MHLWINVFQVEELTLMPSELEKTITDHKKKLEKLEGDKKIEEEKLAAVMESLKTETKVWIYLFYTVFMNNDVQTSSLN